MSGYISLTPSLTSRMSTIFCHSGTLCSFGTLFPTALVSYCDFSGPGHSTACAPLVPDDPRHGWLFLCLHAASLNASQFYCLRQWTLAGQRHGKLGLPSSGLARGGEGQWGARGASIAQLEVSPGPNWKSLQPLSLVGFVLSTLCSSHLGATVQER